MKTFIAINISFINFKSKFIEDNLIFYFLVLFGLLVFYSQSVDTVSAATGDIIHINDSSAEDNQYSQNMIVEEVQNVFFEVIKWKN